MLFSLSFSVSLAMSMSDGDGRIRLNRTLTVMINKTFNACKLKPICVILVRFVRRQKNFNTYMSYVHNMDYQLSVYFASSRLFCNNIETHHCDVDTTSKVSHEHHWIKRKRQYTIK